MNVIIPLCGKGERFVKEGYVDPKPFIKVCGKEILRYVLDSLKLNEHDKVYVIYCYLDIGRIKAMYPWVTWIELEGHTRGAAETIVEGLRKCEMTGPCALLDGDTGYKCDILRAARELGGNGVVCFRGTSAMFSYSVFDAYGIMTDIREKVVVSEWANTGVYVFESARELAYYCQEILDMGVTYKNEYYTSCVIRRMLEDGHVFRGCVVEEKDIVFLGTPAQVRTYEAGVFAFLFDLDNTLVITDFLYLDIWKAILKPFHVDLDMLMFEKYIQGKNDAGVMAGLLAGARVDVGEISAMKDAGFDVRKTLLINGAREFLEACKLAGHRVAIVTNNNRSVAEAMIRHWGLACDALIVGSECAAAKPSPEPYLEALRVLGVRRERAVIFEDSDVGLQAAEGVGGKLVVCVGGRNGGDVEVLTFEGLTIEGVLAMKSTKTIEARLLSAFRAEHVNVSGKLLAGGYIANVVEVEMDDIVGVLKLENPELNVVARSLKLYEHEYFFYEKMAHRVPVDVPRCYGVIESGIVMENLFKRGCVIHRKLDIDQVFLVLREIAKLHRRWWGLKPFKGLEDFEMPYRELVVGRFEAFEKRWRGVFGTENMMLAREIAGRFDEIEEHMKQGELCVIHGDVKAGNLFWDGEKPVFIDWQYVGYGKGVQDVIFFLIESCELKDFEMYWMYYHRVLGIHTYSWDAFMTDLKMAAMYFPFVVAIWFGSLEEDELVDKNFPYLYIQKLFAVYQRWFSAKI